jgi:hypothetical protein
MRDELPIRLGKGFKIHVGQVKGQRFVIGVKRRLDNAMETVG